MKHWSTGRRLVLTVWVLSAAHATTNVVRETYLAVALAERGTIRVDPFLGLHPDLFEIPGRGAYINSNPGASLLGAVPYAAARPLLELVYRSRPELVRAKLPTTYEDPRGNRTLFMNRMRERGLDVRLGLAALVIQVGLMAPLAGLAALLLARFLAARGVPPRTATGLAALYALGTPVLFRSAFLNQNLLLSHAVLFAWIVLRWPQPRWTPKDRAKRWCGAGLLLGTGVLLDYSAAPIAAAFALWAGREDLSGRPQRWIPLRLGALAAGAMGPIAVLLAYQAFAFGSPWFPAQSYMPTTAFSARGWHGMTPPQFDLLWRNLFDPRYGLFVFCPLLLLAFGARPGVGAGAALARDEIRIAWLASASLWLFAGANQFANLQWNTGVRYMVPAAPLLFLLAVPVLLALSPLARAAWIAPTLLVSWSVSMAREDLSTSLRLLVNDGPTLPLLHTLHKTADAYAPWLAGGMQPWGALSVLLLAALLFLLWRPARRSAHA